MTMMHTNPKTGQEAFLRLLTAPYQHSARAFVELRAFTPGAKGGKPSARGWFPLHDQGLSALALRASRVAPASDVYIGVLPRTEGKGGADGLRLCGCLWCDVDGGNEGPREALQLLTNAVMANRVPAPNVLTRSGGGLHAYWLLDPPAPCKTAEEQDRVRRVLRRVVLAVGGDNERAHADRASAEPARVLRLPGTFNHKTGSPRPVTLLRACPPSNDAPARPLVWWAANLPPEPLPARVAFPARSARSERSNASFLLPDEGRLPLATMRLMETGAAPGGIHDAMKRAAVAAVKAGYTDDAAVRDVCAKVLAASGLSPHDPAEARNLDNLTAWACRNVQPDLTNATLGGPR